ncbi:MAG: DUF445 family protein [Leptospira sp.]|nr:DUF445 family protein [Leptospira sp.]
MEFLDKHWDWIKIGFIPFTYGFVGWITNWVALKMTFYPLQFWGIPPYFGWQGIIPRKAHKMANKAVDIITERLLNIEEVFSRLDPRVVEERLMPTLSPYIEESIDEFGRAMNEGIWSRMPQLIKDEIRFKVERASGETLRNFFRDLRENIASIVDVKGIVFHCLTGKNVGLIVEVFQSVGRPEFKFIEKSGFFFGFLLGLMQMIFWLIFPISWTLPLQGVIVGYLTNYLAINMIFRPLIPKIYFGFIHYQGLFIKRQVDVSKKYSHIIATKILTPENIVKDIFTGKASIQVADSIQNAIVEQMDRMTIIAKPIILGAGVQDRYEEVKLQISEKIVKAVFESSYQLESYLDEAIELEKTMGERMARLPPQEFESILRSAFQEDELLLILVGAALGALVGAGQMFLL